MGIRYATREDVKSAAGSAQTARDDARVDRALESASRDAEGLVRRLFYPTYGTRSYDVSGTKLWLLADLWSVASITSNGAAVTGYTLEPELVGPPYEWLVFDAVPRGSTVDITGDFGSAGGFVPAGDLVGAINASATTAKVTDSAAVGVGQTLQVDTERLYVAEKTMTSTGQTLQAPITASAADQAVPVSTGSAYAIGEVLLLDGERVLVVDIAGNTLLTKRAWDGSTLAAHNAGTTVYAPRQLTLVRGILGTTAAAHADGADVTKLDVPGPIRDLVIAGALVQLQQEAGAYASTSGSGQSSQSGVGGALKQAQDRATRLYRRGARHLAV